MGASRAGVEVDRAGSAAAGGPGNRNRAPSIL